MSTAAFSPTGFREILTSAQEHGYALLPFRDALSKKKQPTMILRHDIDFCLEFAVEMAEMESCIGARSTYFIIPRQDFYDPFSPEKKSLIRHIQSLGHEIGLHYDSRQYVEHADGYAAAFRNDLERLSDLIGQPIISAAQHLPTDSPHVEALSLVVHEAYDPQIMERFQYVSDSSMEWREITPEALICQGTNIQFLSHPVWWFASGTTRKEKMMNIPPIAGTHLRGHCERALQYMEEKLCMRKERDMAFRKERGIS